VEEEKELLDLARQASARIKSMFPEWEILAEASNGSAGSEIIARADQWRPDLIVVGSHGRTALAHCSVEIVR
jgi:nucleotide-binding universal stress UspA family protein